MKISEFNNWINQFKASEFPSNSIDYMDSSILTDCLFPLRLQSGIPMWPSPILQAHVRFDGSKTSMHYANGRLSTATDMIVKTHEQMVQLIEVAESIPSIGGFGVYFDTNQPLIHMDTFSSRNRCLTWLARKVYKDKKWQREYVYKQTNPSLFNAILESELAKKQ